MKKYNQEFAPGASLETIASVQMQKKLGLGLGLLYVKRFLLSLCWSLIDT